MRLNLKEDPREWRKAVWLGSLGLAGASSLLRWRHVIAPEVWVGILIALATLGICAAIQPQWFRGYYRFTSRSGFFITQMIGYAVLTILFFLVLTPLGLILRLAGKDLLRLKRPRNVETYWSPAREPTSLDRLF